MNSNVGEISMMLKAQVIGLGAAGNKAAINLVDKGYIMKEDVLLVNSTSKDVPPNYVMSGNVCIIGDGIGGCGQERNKGKEVCLTALQEGKLKIEQFIKPSTDIVFVISSTEGGTGSGSSVVIAQYIRDVVDIDVVLFAITGFEQKPIVPRAIWNTIEFFKDVKDSYHTEIIRNKNFLSDCRGNYMKAEQACNDEIATRFRVLTGQLLIQSDQNIDARDLKKLVVEPGWGNVEFRVVDERVKNVAQFNDLIRDMIDETKSMDVSKPSQKKLGLMVNFPEKDLDAVDYSAAEIIGKYGTPYELFKHIESVDAIEKFVAFVSTGMHLPIEEFEELYNEFEEARNSVNTKQDDFFSKISNMEQGTDMFDLKENRRTEAEQAKAKNDFFSNFGVSTPPTQKTQEVNDSEEPTVNSARNMGEY